MKTGIVFLAVTAGVYALFFCVVFPQWRSYERLAHSGAKTTGRVIKKEPENHQSVRYEYSIASKSYFGSGSTGSRGLPVLYQIRIGDQIPVTYLPKNPSVSLPGDPEEIYSSWSVALFGILPAASLLAGGITAVRLHRKLNRK